MKKSMRALIGLLVIELALLAGTAWMVMQTRTGAWHAPNPAEAITTISSVGGGAMGIVGAILLIAFFVHRKNGN